MKKENPSKEKEGASEKMVDLSINLLPPRKKQEMEDIKLIRTILKIGFTALCALIALAVFMQFCLQAISIQRKAIEREIAQFKKDEAYLKVQTYQDMLRDYNEKSKQIRRELNFQNDYWSIIDDINGFMPEGIALKELSIKEGRLIIRGEAVNRQAVLDLQKGLEESEFFKEIESPISNFVADKGADFEFKAAITEQENK